MLRKKLSKLIVAVMAAVMISGGMNGVGQVVFANSNAGVVATQVTTATVTDANDMEMKLANNSGVELKLIVNTVVELTPAIINSINSRTQPLTIEFGSGGQLVIGAQFTQPVTLGSNNANFDLTLVRGTAKTGAMLTQNTTVDVTIQNVNFDNNGQDEFAFSTDGVAKTTLSENHLIGKGILLNQNTNQAVTFSKNILNEGRLLSNQTLDFGMTHTPGTTVINFYGDVVDTNGTSVNVKSGEATIRVIDPITSVQVKEVPNVIMKVTSDANGKFQNATFSAFVDGLEVSKQYNVELVIEVIDGSGNVYVRTQRDTASTQGNFSSTAVNVTNNSATININHGSLPTTDPTKYPLKINVTGGTVNATPQITTTTTSVNLTGLTANTNYNYEIRDSLNNVISTGTFKTTSSTISGSGSTGGSVVSGDLTTNDINKADIKDVIASIPVGNSTLANSLRDGKDYKTNIEGVTVIYSNGKVEVSGLVPGKEYKDLTITYTDKDGRTRTVKVPTFKTKESETKLRQFIVDVYKYSLGRTPDERGFAYWEDQLKNKKTSPADFVKNLLNEKEFIEKHKTTTEKIEALYQVIVNRSSDSQGLSFWTKKYDDLVARGYSESMALRVVVDEMVNEQEFKNRVQNLGL